MYDDHRAQLNVNVLAQLGRQLDQQERASLHAEVLEAVSGHVDPDTWRAVCQAAHHALTEPLWPTL